MNDDGVTDDDGAELLTRAAAGDRVALEAFVRRWDEPLFRFLERTLGSPHLAADARQRTFVRVIERSGSFRGGQVSTWIFRVALRIAIDLRRHERRRATVPIETAGDVCAGTPDPCDEAARRDERGIVQSAFDEMTEEDRALLWLRVADERPFVEIAAVLGVPEGTARLRFIRALSRMRKRLGPVFAGQHEDSGGVRWIATKR